MLIGQAIKAQPSFILGQYQLRQLAFFFQIYFFKIALYFFFIIIIIVIIISMLNKYIQDITK